jgi:hypothetical protein
MKAIIGFAALILVGAAGYYWYETREPKLEPEAHQTPPEKYAPPPKPALDAPKSTPLVSKGSAVPTLVVPIPSPANLPGPEPILSPSDQELLKLGRSGHWEETLKFIATHYVGNHQQDALSFLLGEVGKENLDSILILAPHFTSRMGTQVAFGIIAQDWMRRGGGELLQFAQSKLQGELKNDLLNQCVSACVGQQHWDRATKIIDQMPFSMQRTSALNSTAWEFAKAEPLAALQWINTLTLPEDKRNAQQSVIIGLEEKKDITTLKQVALQFPPEARGGALSSLGKVAMQGNYPLGSLLQEMNGSPDSRGAVLIGAATVATRAQLDTLIPEYAKLPDGLTRNRVAARIAGQMFSDSQTDAINWMFSLPQAEKDYSLRTVVTKWYNTDSLQLSDWVNGLADAHDQDTAKETMVGLLRRSDKEAAKGIAMSIKDPKRRDQVVRDLH